MTAMITVGVDLATTTGLARLDNGTLAARGTVKAADYTDVLSITAFCQGADLVAIENVYCGANVATAIKLATLRGRLIQSLDCGGIPWVLCAPSTWRKATFKPAPKTKRKALKAASQAWALATYGIEVGEDVADAIGLASWAQAANAERI